MNKLLQVAIGAVLSALVLGACHRAAESSIAAELPVLLAASGAEEVISLRRFAAHTEGRTASIVVFNSRLCASCGDSSVVRKLNRLQEPPLEVRMLVLFPNDFTDSDIRNAATNLGLELPASRTDPVLDRELRALAARYGEKEVNGSIVSFTGEVATYFAGVDDLIEELEAQGASEQ